MARSAAVADGFRARHAHCRDSLAGLHLGVTFDRFLGTRLGAMFLHYRSGRADISGCVQCCCW